MSRSDSTAWSRCALTAALLLAVVPFVRAQAGGQDGDGAQQHHESSTSRRTATEAELQELFDDFEAARRSKEQAKVRAVLVRMAGFTNEELCEAVEDGLGYKASKKDVADAKAEAEALDMKDKETIQRLVDVRIAEVVSAAADLAVSIGTEKSADLLVDAIGDRKINTNTPAITAVVAGLSRHPQLGPAADDEVKEILYSIGAHDLDGDKFPQSPKEVKGYDEVGKYSAAIRYFGARKSKDLAVVLYLAEMLRPPHPVSPDSPDNPPQAYWEKRHTSWMRYKRDVVWTLREITGQTWKAAHDDEGGQCEEAIVWIHEHAKDLDLK
ncbi:MAG: hypothetical protein R3F34_12940 [Planctomycetota bacterium]